MPLSSELREYISACFTGLWVESHEHDDALAEIAQLCQQENWNLAVWDIEQGLQVQGSSVDTEPAAIDPLSAVQAVSSIAVGTDATAILVLRNFHRFFSAEVIQALARQIHQGKHTRCFVIILSPVVDVPLELEKQIVVLQHELPTREQLEEIARGVATEEGELPAGQELDSVLDAASGLTRFEAEGAFALSLVREQRLSPSTLWSIKSQQLKKSGLLTLHRGHERFADLGGLDAAKSFCLRAMRQQGSQDPLKRPRGVMLLSPPGGGKSQFAKALGNETGRPTIVLDIGQLMGSLVGQSEQRTRQALQMIDAMEPAVVMIDEVEKALSGVSSSGQSDSGVTARMFGAFLSWLNDHESDVFVVCTCNDISKLPPEFSRSERFDGIFFFDLPNKEQRQAIWDIYLPMFGHDSEQARPDDNGWTGAEIRACCRLAALLDVPLEAAAQNVVPVSITAAESVASLRKWASGRCLDAHQAGVYRYQSDKVTQRKRRVTRSSDN